MCKNGELRGALTKSKTIKPALINYQLAIKPTQNIPYNQRRHKILHCCAHRMLCFKSVSAYASYEYTAPVTCLLYVLYLFNMFINVQEPVPSIIDQHPAPQVEAVNAQAAVIKVNENGAGKFNL